jgi:energy-converting hydrogenase Eha subunit C
LQDIFQSLQQNWFATGLRESLWMFPILYTLHIFGVVILVGATSALDLRMLGLILRDEPVPDLGALLLPWAKAGFVAQVVTGTLLFVAQAADLWHNIAFLLKMAAVLVAGLNVLIFHLTAYRNVERWPNYSTPAGAKFSAIFSLACWFTIVAMSRLIAFV